MAPTPTTPTPFDLGHEIGVIQTKLDGLMARTDGLPALTAKVERHDVEIGFIRKIGYFCGLGIIGMVGSWLKAKFGW